jgi:hypothetical protein
LSNQTSALADVVSLDAWHDEFSEQIRAVDLFVDVVFSAGRLGSEEDALVRFELCVRRAEVVVVVPPTEPITVDPASVSRDTPQVSGKRTKNTQRGRAWSGGFWGVGGLLAGAPGLAGKAQVHATANASASEKIEEFEELKPIAVKNSKTEDAHHRWTVTPVLKEFLDGRPWDPKAEPRLKLVDQRSGAKGVPPSVRVEVRCRREDLQISNIVLKDKRRWDTAKARTGYRNREIAAEAYIRDQLLRRGLVVGDLRDTSAQMTLSMTFPEPRPKY